MKKPTIKFGKSDRGWDHQPGNDITFPILLRYGKGKWIEIGTMEASYDEVGLGMAHEYRISEYIAEFWIEEVMENLSSEHPYPQALLERLEDHAKGGRYAEVWAVADYATLSEEVTVGYYATEMRRKKVAGQTTAEAKRALKARIVQLFRSEP